MVGLIKFILPGGESHVKSGGKLVLKRNFSIKLLSLRLAAIASASRGSRTTLLLLAPALFTVLYKRYSPNPTTIPSITYPGIPPC
jgi:hypothetical protein